MEEEVDELGDLKVIDVTAGSPSGVMIKPCCFVPSLSSTPHAEMPWMLQPVRVASTRLVLTNSATLRFALLRFALLRVAL